MAKKKVKEQVEKPATLSGPCEDCNETGLLDGVVDATSLCPTCNGSGKLGDNMNEEVKEEVTPEETTETPVVEESTEE